MRRDDGDDASRGQDEPSSACLRDGIIRFIPHLGGIAQRERVLSQAAADRAQDL